MSSNPAETNEAYSDTTGQWSRKNISCKSSAITSSSEHVTSFSPICNPTSRKTVRFSMHNQVKDTININDLKQLTDIESIWFSNEEYDTIRSECLDVVSCIESGLPVDTEQDCTRGLERHVATARKNRKRNIIESVLAVLEEQDLQRDEGVNDPELLADVYFARSYKCSDASHKTGLQDRKEVVPEKLGKGPIESVR